MRKTMASVLSGLCLLLTLPALAGGTGEVGGQQEYIKALTVQAQGRLTIPEAVILEAVPEGVSGMLLHIQGKAYWLAFAKDKRGQELRQRAEKFRDCLVRVTGTLETRPFLLPPGQANVIVVTGLEAAAPDVGRYLTTDGKLTAPLKLAIGKNRGLVGGSIGTTWVIEPSGAWTRTQTFQAGVVKGQLTAAQLAALAQHLATQDFVHLPDQLGVSPYPDNTLPYVAITFGKKSTTLYGPLLPSLPGEGSTPGDDWSRFVAVTLLLQDVLQHTGAEPK
jgi:hypothetical protein